MRKEQNHLPNSRRTRTILTLVDRSKSGVTRGTRKKLETKFSDEFHLTRVRPTGPTPFGGTLPSIGSIDFVVGKISVRRNKIDTAGRRGTRKGPVLYSLYRKITKRWFVIWRSSRKIVILKRLILRRGNYGRSVRDKCKCCRFSYVGTAFSGVYIRTLNNEK